VGLALPFSLASFMILVINLSIRMVQAGSSHSWDVSFSCYPSIGGSFTSSPPLLHETNGRRRRRGQN